MLLSIHFNAAQLGLTDNVKTLIPNVATDVFGAFLGIRVYNFLIERRSKYHNARRVLLNSFFRFIELARATSLDVNKKQIDSLRQQRRFLDEDILPKMDGRLYLDERTLVEELTDLEEKVIQQLDSYFCVNIKLSKFRNSIVIGSLPDSLQKSFEVLDGHYKDFLRNYSDEGEHLESELGIFRFF